MQKPLVMIEDWGVVGSVIAHGFEELQPGNHLTGFVIGHAHLSRTKRVFTSPIVTVDVSQALVETKNTMYRLGDASVTVVTAGGWEAAFRRLAGAGLDVTLAGRALRLPLASRDQARDALGDAGSAAGVTVSSQPANA